MRNDRHFGQLRIFNRKVYIIGWNVLRSIRIQDYFRINQISIKKMNCLKEFYFKKVRKLNFAFVRLEH
jgi:hypothetical protein